MIIVFHRAAGFVLGFVFHAGRFRVFFIFVLDRYCYRTITIDYIGLPINLNPNLDLWIFDLAAGDKLGVQQLLVAAVLGPARHSVPEGARLAGKGIETTL